MTDFETTKVSINVFEPDRLYGQPEFTAKGCGGKTYWWRCIHERRFRVVYVGRLAKATGGDLNAYLASRVK